MDSEETPPVNVQPTLFEPPPRDCPCCTRADGTPNGRWPRVEVIGGWPKTFQCPNCGGSGSVQIKF